MSLVEACNGGAGRADQIMMVSKVHTRSLRLVKHLLESGKRGNNYFTVNSAPPMPMNNAPVVRLVKRERAALWRTRRFIHDAHAT